MLQIDRGGDPCRSAPEVATQPILLDPGFEEADSRRRRLRPPLLLPALPVGESPVRLRGRTLEILYQRPLGNAFQHAVDELSEVAASLAFLHDLDRGLDRRAHLRHRLLERERLLRLELSGKPKDQLAADAGFVEALPILRHHCLHDRVQLGADRGRVLLQGVDLFFLRVPRSLDFADDEFADVEIGIALPIGGLADAQVVGGDRDRPEAREPGIAAVGQHDHAQDAKGLGLGQHELADLPRRGPVAL